MKPDSGPIVFFDGVCNLCNHAVDFIIRHDTPHRIRYASLQGETAASRLPDELRSSLSTLVLLHKEQIFTHSTAVIHIALLMGWPWKMAIVFFIVPRFLRDALYTIIARYRYRWWGRRPTCRIPSAEERLLFLP